MTEAPNNLIIFPTWRKTLEEESLQALKEKRYEEALEKLNQLTDYQVENYEIITGKLICLMELSRFSEAQTLCEEALSKKDENYLHYIHIYLTILFQTNQYDLLMEQIELEMENSRLSTIQRDQFNQLYEVSKKLKVETEEDEIGEALEEFFQAIEANHFQAQWVLFQKLKRNKMKPEKKIINLLTNDSVHPVLKTAIFLWLKEQDYSQSTVVQKFEKKSNFIPVHTTQWDETDFFSETLTLLSEIENDNPTLYNLTKKLLIYLSYVVYPFLPEEKDIYVVRDALIRLGKEYLNMEIPSNGNALIQHYMDLIKLSEKLYTSIIEP